MRFADYQEFNLRPSNSTQVTLHRIYFIHSLRFDEH